MLHICTNSKCVKNILFDFCLRVWYIIVTVVSRSEFKINCSGRKTGLNDSLLSLEIDLVHFTLKGESNVKLKSSTLEKNMQDTVLVSKFFPNNYSPSKNKLKNSKFPTRLFLRLIFNE